MNQDLIKLCNELAEEIVEQDVKIIWSGNHSYRVGQLSQKLQVICDALRLQVKAEILQEIRDAMRQS